ncbi:MAG: hypothetical protein AAFQ63_04635 [Cyanobacteria bacterium J06621_11]
MNPNNASPNNASPNNTTYEQVSQQLATLPPGHLQALQGLLSGWLLTTELESLPVSPGVAQAVVNDWLLQALSDRFIALTPKLIAGGDIWSVPVGLAYPKVGVIGQVGEVLVSAFSKGIISASKPDAIKAAGLECYQKKEHEIKAAFLSTRNT